MKASRRVFAGKIVVIAGGLLPTPCMVYYPASKYALVGFAHALRTEARPFNVTISAVCPGFVKTPIYAK